MFDIASGCMVARDTTRVYTSRYKAAYRIGRRCLVADRYMSTHPQFRSDSIRLLNEVQAALKGLHVGCQHLLYVLALATSSLATFTGASRADS